MSGPGDHAGRRAANSWISFPQWGQSGALGKSSRIRILVFVTPECRVARISNPLQRRGIVGTIGPGRTQCHRERRNRTASAGHTPFSLHDLDSRGWVMHPKPVHRPSLQAVQARANGPEQIRVGYAPGTASEANFIRLEIRCHGLELHRDLALLGRQSHRWRNSRSLGFSAESNLNRRVYSLSM